MDDTERQLVVGVLQQPNALAISPGAFALKTPIRSVLEQVFSLAWGLPP